MMILMMIPWKLMIIIIVVIMSVSNLTMVSSFLLSTSTNKIPLIICNQSNGCRDRIPSTTHMTLNTPIAFSRLNYRSLHARIRRNFEEDESDDDYERMDVDDDDNNYNEDNDEFLFDDDDEYDGYDDDYDYFDEDEYDDYDDDEEEEEDDDLPPLEWEWETYQQSTHIYLPPPILPTIGTSSKNQSNDESSSAQEQKEPTTIIHFIGGTLFGSYPLQFYKTFLEQIAQKSNSIIVATSIPVSFQSNPLDHYKLCRDVSKAFRQAFRNVICDEYGMEISKKMKIVGLGHSLGSRLHCIISSDTDEDDIMSKSGTKEVDTEKDNERRRSRKWRKSLHRIAMKRQGNILLAFNNYSALSSVPGVQSLEKGVRETRKEEKEMKDRIKQQKLRSNSRRKRRSRKGRDVDYDNDDDYYYELSRKKRRPRNDDDDDYYDDNYDYFDDDEDDLDLSDIVTSIKSSLTPDVDKSSLEFQPSPDDLWDMLTHSYSRNIPNTLIVQFDNDNIDQSSRLAQEILESESFQNQESKEKLDAIKDVVTDKKERIFFARLKGTHLNPVSYSDSFGILRLWKRFSALPMDDLLREAIDEDEKASKRRSKRKDASQIMKRNNMNDLTNSISRYIVDIIN